MTGAELWAAAQASPARQAAPAAYTPGETVEWLRAHGVTNQERLLSMALPEYVPASENEVRAALSTLPDQVVNAVLVAQKWHDTLTPNTPLQFGFNTADGYDGGVLPLLRWLRLSGLLVDSPRPDGVLLTRLQSAPSTRQLDLLGVRYLVANAGAAPPPDSSVVDFGDLRLFVRNAPVARSLVVFGARSVANESSALDRLASPDFDPNREVVLEGTPESVGASAAAQPVDPRLARPDRWQAHVSLAQSGYLLQREAWYPGWRARVDGADAPLLRADVLFRAVPLTAGEHDVEVFFESDAFNRGALLSGVGWFVIIVALIWPRLPRMRPRAEG
jgi:hypothetical protein